MKKGQHCSRWGMLMDINSSTSFSMSSCIYIVLLPKYKNFKFLVDTTLYLVIIINYYCKSEKQPQILKQEQCFMCSASISQCCVLELKCRSKNMFFSLIFFSFSIVNAFVASSHKKTLLVLHIVLTQVQNSMRLSFKTRNLIGCQSSSFTYCKKSEKGSFCFRCVKLCLGNGIDTISRLPSDLYSLRKYQL